MEPLILKGNAYQRGISHGKRFATEIRECLNAFKHESSDQAIMSAVDKTIELLGGTFPEINEEIRGISDGAEVPFRDTFLFNNRAVVNMVDTETCSDLAIQAGGTVVVGMNKDRSCPMAPYEKYFLKKVYPEEGYALITYGHVGRVWGHGMNEQGLCTAGTAAYPLHNDAVVPSFGSYLVPPLLLSKCKDVPEALDLLEQFRPICDSGNFLLCDAAGEMAVVEITPAQRVVVPDRLASFPHGGLRIIGPARHDQCPATDACVHSPETMLIRQRWQFVPADHGGTARLFAHRNGRADTYRQAAR